MNITTSEVLEFVLENDIKFIRLSFCDPFGCHKNMSIMADELPNAFEYGVSFDAHAVRGFRDVTKSDLLLFPDATTLKVLPWRPGTGRVARFFCDIKNLDRSPFTHDGRYILTQVVERCEKMGYICKIGAESEFYLFKTDQDGEPTFDTLDKGGYLDISPLDKGENIRREICLTLEEMGIKPETSHHEQGPGQNEIDFKFGNALESADNLLTFKSVVKAVAARNGLFASFMPKPIPEQPGSGLHVNISLLKNGQNIFDHESGDYSDAANSFIAGILAKVAEITLFLNPLVNSYERFGMFEAPKYVSWSHQNRSQLVRIPAAVGDKVRIELRSPDPSVNPYIAFALIISAGLYGIENNLELSPAVDANLYTADESVTGNLATLPDSLNSAIMAARNSSFVLDVLGETLLNKYITIKQAEYEAFVHADDKNKFYRDMYWNIT